MGFKCLDHKIKWSLKKAKDPKPNLEFKTSTINKIFFLKIKSLLNSQEDS